MTDPVDERARAMSDDQRTEYLLSHGWTCVGVWLPPGPTTGVVQLDSGGYSRSAAIREALAREDPEAVPNELGRYWHGAEPDRLAAGQSW